MADNNPTTAPELDPDQLAGVSPEETPQQQEPTSEPEATKPTATVDAEPTTEQPDQEPVKPHKDSRIGRLKATWKNWWGNPIKKRASLTALAILLMMLAVLPGGRYFVLNTVGVRSGASVTVLDSSTRQPLKNVQVQLGNKTATTDDNGRASFSKLRLGRNRMHIEKRAFAALDRYVTLGWGSNPLGDVDIKPVGSQYRFQITDYLSGKPVFKAEATVGEASAFSDEQGELILTLDLIDDQSTAEVKVGGDGYRQETVNLNLESDDTVKLRLVPARPHVFISKRSGRYDIYKIDADGKNETKVLAGSGSERDDLVLVSHPTKAIAALVSTRENVRNKEGYLLQTLTLVDLESNTPTKLAQSERVQVIGWQKDRLVYVMVTSGASASSPDRHKLMSYDSATGKTVQLANANYFNDVIAVGDSIFYAPSNAYSDQGSDAFYKISPDGSNKQKIMSQEVWNIFRTGYDEMTLAVGQKWYHYEISANRATSLSGEPADLKARVYVDSPSKQKSVWIDQRDGKGVLLAYDLGSKADAIITSLSGLSNPVEWLNNNSVVFRVSNNSEVADYVVSLDGGEPKKLKDVTNTSGLDRWYYY